MSVQGNDDHPARDPRFDATWHEVSNEEPPAALDAALRAAARREVGAGPARVDPALREATRPERWWFPLAAAATIGAIALGLLQIIEPGRTSGDDPSTIVSDTPPGTTIPARESPPNVASVPAPVVIGPAAGGRGVAVPSVASMYPMAPEAARDEAATAARPEAKLLRRPAAEGSPEVFGARDSGSVALGKLAQRRDEPAPTRAIPAPREHPAPATAESAVLASPPSVASPSTPRPASTPQRLAAGPAAPDAAAAGATDAVTTRAERRRADVARDAQGARTPLPVAEWIALIRRLRDEGKVDEAAKELAAFRDAHPDHEQRLPPDLARWRPDAK